LQRLHALEEKISIQILPIIGVGSAPFRGNLKPTNVPNCATEYPSVQTFTIQSAFKYDYPPEVVRLAVEQLNETNRKKPLFIDEEIALRIINKVKKEYTQEIMSLYPLINQISKYVPSRRSRKLHIGLFGYSRTFEKVKLPRAIPFCASLYSIGLPPEMLGLGTLNEKELDLLSGAYVKFEEDLRDALQFFNKNNLKYLPRLLQKKLAKVQTYVDYAANEQHEKATSYIMDLVKKENFANLREEIEKTAHIRRFLG
jgi:phosphoenolpyruvate carboxylase